MCPHKERVVARPATVFVTGSGLYESIKVLLEMPEDQGNSPKGSCGRMASSSVIRDNRCFIGWEKHFFERNSRAVTGFLIKRHVDRSIQGPEGFV